MRYETYDDKNPLFPFFLHRTKLPPRGTIGIANWHENVEFLYFTEGDATILSGDKTIHIHAGEIAVINSNEIHSLVANSNISYYCLIIFTSFCTRNCFDITKDYFQPQIRDEEMNRLLEELASICMSRQSEGQHGMTIAKNDITDTAQILSIYSILLRFLSILYQKHKCKSDFSTASHRHECIKLAITYIRQNCERDITLDEISGMVKMSKFYFSSEFKKVTGYAFVTFLNISRCEKAKHLLSATDTAISEIGIQCGFSDPSYFTRTFTKQYGISPSEYRRKKKV